MLLPGHPDGPPVLYFHGHPGARREAALLADPAHQLGIRLIGIDRPGLGLSTYQPHRRLLNWPADVDTLAITLPALDGMSSPVDRAGASLAT